MQFHVPQFIEIEDKIFGPLTFKQFIYVVGGAGLSYIIYRFLPLWIGVVLIAFVVALSLALAFYKVNNKPFIDILQAALRFFTRNRLYLWKKQTKPDSQKKMQGESKAKQPLTVPRISESKLRDLTWSLEVEDTAVSRDRSERDTLNH